MIKIQTLFLFLLGFGCLATQAMKLSSGQITVKKKNRFPKSTSLLRETLEKENAKAYDIFVEQLLNQLPAKLEECYKRASSDPFDENDNDPEALKQIKTAFGELLHEYQIQLSRVGSFISTQKIYPIFNEFKQKLKVQSMPSVKEMDAKSLHLNFNLSTLDKYYWIIFAMVKSLEFIDEKIGQDY